MMRPGFSSLAVAALCAGPAQAANVYILASGQPLLDASVVAALQAGGHTTTFGVQFNAFDGTQNLAGFRAVYLQANANWSTGDMPAAGQAQLLSFINAGGGLVTSERSVWKASTGTLAALSAAFPAQLVATLDANATAQFDQVAPDPVVNAGLPASFTFPLDSYSGTETRLTPRPGAMVFYHNPLNNSEGLLGWGYGQGRVMNFATTNGPMQVADASFGRLLSNAVDWAGGAPCYANCDASTTAPVLNVLDFSCFLNRFAAGSPYANCDGSTTPPVLNVLDFSCFLSKFAAGCP